MKKTLLTGLYSLLFFITPLLMHAQQVKLAAWNFNNTYTSATNVAGDTTLYTPTTTSTTATTTLVSTGKFKVFPDSAVTAATNYFYNGASSSYQLKGGYNNMVATLKFAGPNAISVYTDGAGHKNYFQFSFPTLGYDNVNLVFNFGGGQNSSSDFLRLVYSTDGGTTWLDAGSNYNTQSGWWLYKTYTATIAARNKAKVIVRLLCLTTSTSTTANFNLDFLRIYGTVYVPGSTPTYKVTASVSPAGAGGISINPAGNEFDEGTNVTLSYASRNFGYRFRQWQDSKGNVLSTNPSYSFKLMKDTSVVALYEPLTTYNFALNLLGSKWGNITLSPAPTNGKYEAGTNVSMAVVPNNVTSFSFWDDNSTATTRSVIVSKDTTLSATFDQMPFITGWDFKVNTPNSKRVGDYYAESGNKGLFNLCNYDGTFASWLANTGSFSPSQPCAYQWNGASNVSTRQSYFKASFSTIGYTNIRVKSQMAASYQHYTVDKLQVSLDSINYTDLNSITVSTSVWTDLNATLPVEYENKNKVFVRWIEDPASTLTGNTTDVDGTAITNVFIFADKKIDNDVTPPVLVSSLPADGSVTAPVNGSVVLTFNEQVKAGTGTPAIGATGLTAVFGVTTVTLSYSKLAYNTDYTLTVPAGVFTDLAGNQYAGITLHFHTMNKPLPSPRAFDAVVAKDGTGNYSTIQAAVDATPDGRIQPWLIFVKNGTYKGHVDIPSSKPYINLIGQSRDSVIISDARISGTSSVYPDSVVYGVDPGATVVVKSANCFFENICFENKFGYDNVSGPQALALYTTNDRIILNNCWLRSYQDTYLTTYGSVSNRHYLKKCRIEGAVDFIYGGGDVLFDQCQIYCRRATGGYIVAPGHLPGSKWGYVFDNCTIDGPSSSYTTYLGRPWANSPMASFFNTVCKIGIYDEGWVKHMGALPAVFADYNSMNAGGNPLDLSKRINRYWIMSGADTIWSVARNSYTDAEAANFTYANVTSGSDGWDPRALIEPTTTPVNAKNNSGVITWDATPYAICYLVERNGKVIGLPTTNSFTDASYSPTATYKITAVAESGALSAAVLASGGITTESNTLDAARPCVYKSGRTMVVKNVIPGAKISVYNFAGALLSVKTSVSSVVTFNVPAPCIVRVVSENNAVVFKVAE